MEGAKQLKIIATLLAALYWQMLYVSGEADANFSTGYFMTTLPSMTKRLKWPKIYVYGDSLTQQSFSIDGGWGSIVADEFRRKADFIARGFSGYNTRHCRALLPYLENDIKEITIAGVFLGANDANDPKLNPQGVPLEEYRINLKSIVETMKAAGVKSILMITPPALDEVAWKKRCDNDEAVCAKTAAMVAKYATACAETAKELELPFVDLHTAMLQQNNWKEFLSDGLHFSPKGSEFVASQIIQSLRVLWDNLDPIKGSEEIMPNYKDLSTDPRVSFEEWMKKYQ